MTRRIRTLLPIIWLMSLLLLPLIAYLFGLRQPLLENREKTTFPSLNRTAVRKDNTFRQMDAAIRERLPLRGEAIETRGRIAMRIFGDSTNEEVIFGEDDWLYFRPELLICEPAGRPSVPPEDAIEILTRTITASDRRPVVIVAGSKIVTHQTHLKGVTEAELDCLGKAEGRVQKRLEETPGSYSIQAQLDALEATGRATFLRSDTHWNALGRKVFVEALLDGVRPGLAAEVRLRARDEFNRSGDLGPLVGQDRVDRDRRLTVTRKPKAGFARDEVLIVGDSQLKNSLLVPGADRKTIFDHVFSGQPLCDQYEMQEHGCADQMLDAKIVVLETVARNYQLVESICWRPVAALAETVKGLPARWADGEAVRRPTSGTTLATVGFSRDRPDVPRLLRIPVHGLPAGNGDSPVVTVVPEGATQPCALTAVPNGGLNEIVIPVASGERIADLKLKVSGPEGTELGRPEVLILDDRPLTPRR